MNQVDLLLLNDRRPFDAIDVLGYGFLEKVYENKAQLINYLKATNK
jgi:hypothetical protein